MPNCKSVTLSGTQLKKQWSVPALQEKNDCANLLDVAEKPSQFPSALSSLAIETLVFRLEHCHPAKRNFNISLCVWKRV